MYTTLLVVALAAHLLSLSLAVSLYWRRLRPARRHDFPAHRTAP